VAGAADAAAAFRAIAGARATFVSRGDRSGTHAAELRTWGEAGIDIAGAKGAWYKEIGQGMGPALNVAAALGAYVLADRGTWLSFRNRSGLRILVEGDARLRNPYGVIRVNPARHPHVRAAEAQAFIDWLVSPEGQAAIGAYTVEGERLFFPDAQAPPRAGAPSAAMRLAGAE
jgi:tungstate transport system substrate-binding protein